MNFSVPPLAYDMKSSLKIQLAEFQTLSQEKSDEILSQITTIKDVLSLTGNFSEWFNKKVLDKSIQKIKANTDNEIARKLLEKIEKLRCVELTQPTRNDTFLNNDYNAPSLSEDYNAASLSEYSSSNQAGATLCEFSPWIQSEPIIPIQKAENPKEYDRLAEKSELNPKAQPNRQQTKEFNMSSEEIDSTLDTYITPYEENPAQQSETASATYKGNNTKENASLHDQRMVVENDNKVPNPFLPKSVSPHVESIGFEEPITLNQWVDESLGNRIGYILSHLNRLTYLPLNHSDTLLISKLINELQHSQENHHFVHCKEAIIIALDKFKDEINFQNGKEILKSLIYQEPLRTAIVDELKEAINPIMRYLADLQKFNHSDIISKIKEFQSVLRRWGFIERGQSEFGFQSDPSECLQALYDYLQEPGDQYSQQITSEVCWQATLKQNESDWTIQDMTPEEKLKMLQDFIKHVGKKYPSPEAEIIKHVNLLGENIYIRGKVQDVDGNEIENFPSLEETLKPRIQKVKFPLCIQAYVNNGNLLDHDNFNNNLNSLFAGVTEFTGYRIQNHLIQKVTVPVLETKVTFSGEYPTVLIIQPMAQFASRHEMDLPEVQIPKKITFGPHEYSLSKCSIKSGNQNGGHYTFWTTHTEEKSQYADSLKRDEEFILEEIELSKKVSGIQNVTLLEYQRIDIPKKPIKQKLYQGLDHLCYLIQALYFIYENPLFSSINQTEKFTIHNESELNHQGSENRTAQTNPESEEKKEIQTHKRKRKDGNEPKASRKKPKSSLYDQEKPGENEKRS